MSTSPLSSQEIRAAAGAHHELGPEYHDEVVASFLAKIETEIQSRVDARLADSPSARRQLDPATLARRRLMLKHMALGSVVGAIPLSFVVYAVALYRPEAARALVVVWTVIAAVYAAAAFRLRSGRRDRH